MIRQQRLVEAHKSLTSLKNGKIPLSLSNLVSIRLDELEHTLCVYQPALLRSLRGEVFLESRVEINLGILFPNKWFSLGL